MLLQAGANINQLNSWKLSPVTVAFLKHHTNIVKKILALPDINVNCKDDNGRTLIANTACNFELENYDLVDILINKHKSDLRIMDIEKKYPAHHLLRNFNSLNFQSNLITHNSSIIEDSKELLSRFKASNSSIASKFQNWVTAICNNLEMFSRADSSGSSAISYFVNSVSAYLSKNITGGKNLLQGKERIQKKDQYTELKKQDIFKHHYTEFDVELTKTQTERVKWMILFITNLYKQAKESNQRMAWPKKELTSQESDMQEEQPAHLDEIDCLTVVEFKKLNADFFSNYLAESIKELKALKIPSMDEFLRASSHTDVTKFIDSCKQRDEILAKHILDCCRIFIEELEYDVESSTKYIKKVDRYANMTIDTESFLTPLEVVLNFLLKRHEGLPTLTKTKA